MTKASEIKRAYEEYIEASKATDAIKFDDDEELFDQLLEVECEKLDTLAELIVEFTGGQVTDMEARRMAGTEKFAELIKRIAA